MDCPKCGGKNLAASANVMLFYYKGRVDLHEGPHIVYCPDCGEKFPDDQAMDMCNEIFKDHLKI